MPTSATGHRADNPHLRYPSVAIDPKLWAEITDLPIRPNMKYPDETLLGTIDGRIKVIVVDGDRIKLDHDMDFVEGGNGAEDPELCAADEIYIDDNVQPHDWPFIIYHEAYERRLMAKGMKYDEAHKHANAAERILRMQFHR